MDKAIKHHLGKEIIHTERLKGGYSFKTYLLTLCDKSKVVFRGRQDFRRITIKEVLERERYFYGRVNEEIGKICPEVYVVDCTLEHHGTGFCVMEYIEGMPLKPYIRSGISEQEQSGILNQIGGIAAKINGIRMDDGHPFMVERGRWEDYISDRIGLRLSLLVNSGVITQSEIKAITDGMRAKKAIHTDRILHLDLRYDNMIINGGKVFVVDAENCEFGDPLWEIATIDNAGELKPEVVEAYLSAFDGEIDLNSELYWYYKMERAALVLNVYLNEVEGHGEQARRYGVLFDEVKNRLVGRG
jgi:aminoglycoside phosphotransferase (APT) family kinase protein